MNTSAEAADQVVRLALNGVEVAAKITGTGAKELAVLLYAILKDQKKTKGKTRLSSMLKSGKELKVFAVKQDDLERFCKEAKKYGVLYCVLRDKNAKDGLTDVMVRAEDASKINRIFERFKLATVDVGQIQQELERASAAELRRNDQRTEEGASRVVDVLLQPVPEPEEEQHHANPTMGLMEPETPSEPFSEDRKRSAAEGRGGSELFPRTSVRQELKQIRQEQKDKTAARKNPERHQPFWHRQKNERMPKPRRRKER